MSFRKNKKILVTGGAGYIGAHMVRLLREKGYAPVVFDNLSTGFRSFVPNGVPFVKGDLRRPKDIECLFKKYNFSAVIHFAASIVVSESVTQPLEYYENNVVGSLNLVKAMIENKVYHLVFSSTAAIYGKCKDLPVKEDCPAKPENPYAATKYIVEQMLHDVSAATPLRYVALRYFNVTGSHPRGDIGIKKADPTHLIPSIMKVARGVKNHLIVFGDDYDTPDGTCIRDYIYVMDLCDAHLKALKVLQYRGVSDVFNLGTERGFTVKEVVDLAKEVTGKKIPYVIGKRRAGDIPSLIANCAKAEKILKWKHKTSLREMLLTAWNWEIKSSG
ncbi:MAG: UDP-glucose 4-epimerase GalE [Candidatus Omnitrophica bacterium]|nr:UDP-glucose 4-epimerase GalE [Candidatus Omnitrophota bacterium]